MCKAESKTCENSLYEINNIRIENHKNQQQAKNQQLAELHLDENLLIVNYDGCIDKFIYVTHNDINRPIYHFSIRFNYENLVNDLQSCLNSNTEHQLFFRFQTKTLYLLRMIPFRQGNRKLISLIFYEAINHEPINKTTSLANSEYVPKDIEQLVTKNKKLQQTNKELLSATYTIAHDLKQPLSTINKLVELLSRCYVNDLKESGKTYFEYINISLKSMQNLVNSLLEHAQYVHHKQLQMNWVNVHDLLQQVKVNLLGVLDNNNIIIHLEKLPTYVFANEVRLYQLFFNLLSNAIKFRKTIGQCRIKVKATEEKRYWKFFITDNGIGIEKKHFNNIFQLLTKLNAPEEYAGNGIGLSICKKIVEQHKGEIAVSSELGYGSTFTFTIQKQ